MKARIYDMEILSSISHTDIITYLKSEKWIKSDTFGNNAIIFENNNEELFVPTSAVKDFAIRVSEILKKLEKIENRSQLEIFRDITYSGFDVFRVRNTSPDVVNGSLPLGMGLAFGSGAYELILSAANSSSSKKPIFLGKKTADVDEYMHNVRMGQTEQGSFVFTFLAPIPPRVPGDELSFMPVDDPFSRKVTKTLVKGLNSLNSAINKFSISGKFDHFVEAVSFGVSANMCDAIAKIANNSNGDVEVNISWARTRELMEEIDSSVKVARDDIPVIQEASHTYKTKQPEIDSHLLGVIVKCEKEPDSDAGRVTILDIGSGVPRRISVDLSGEHYQDAVQAHKDGKNISCSGTILKNGKKLILADHSELKMFDPEHGVDDSASDAGLPIF